MDTRRAGTGVSVLQRRQSRTSLPSLDRSVGIRRTLVLAGIPARSNARRRSAAGTMSADLLDVTVAPSEGIATIDLPTARRIVRDLVADLGYEADALRRRDAPSGCGRGRVAARGLWRQINSDGQSAVRRSALPRRRVARHPGARRRQGSHRSWPPSRDGRVLDQLGDAADGRAPQRSDALRADVRAQAEGRSLPDHRRQTCRRSSARAPSGSTPLGRARRRSSAGCCAQVGLDFTARRLPLRRHERAARR